MLLLVENENALGEGGGARAHIVRVSESRIRLRNHPFRGALLLSRCETAYR